MRSPVPNEDSKDDEEYYSKLIYIVNISRQHSQMNSSKKIERSRRE